jgi:aspartate racemase
MYGDYSRKYCDKIFFVYSELTIVIMRTIGIIGGISWVSTLDYYRMINKQISDRLGKLHSSKIVLVSIDLQEYATLLHNAEFEQVKQLIKNASQQLSSAGADFIIICSNTAHIAVPTIINIPLLHIADCCAKSIKAHKITRIGFIGTKFTMQGDFIQSRLRQHGLQVFTPTNENEISTIQNIIENELSHNVINERSKFVFLSCIDRLVRDHNVQGVILGCTEIPLLIKQSDVGEKVFLFDSSRLHVNEAVNIQLGVTCIESYLPVI